MTLLVVDAVGADGLTVAGLLQMRLVVLRWAARQFLTAAARGRHGFRVCRCTRRRVRSAADAEAAATPDSAGAARRRAWLASRQPIALSAKACAETEQPDRREDDEGRAGTKRPCFANPVRPHLEDGVRARARLPAMDLFARAADQGSPRAAAGGADAAAVAARSSSGRSSCSVRASCCGARSRRRSCRR